MVAVVKRAVLSPPYMRQAWEVGWGIQGAAAGSGRGDGKQVLGWAALGAQRWLRANAGQLAGSRRLCPQHHHAPTPPQKELEYLSLAGEREDYILARALEPGAATHAAFAGAHVLPLWPGPAAA